MSETAALYIRVSTDEQAEHGISIPAQRSRLESYCRARGWEIFDFYVDDGFSGKDLDRPAIRHLIEDAGLKKFSTLLVLKLDRLSRRQKDVLHLLEDVFEPLNIGFKSVTEAFDTTTPFGKAALGMMAVFAQLERETIVERVKMAKKEGARQGRFMGGPAPYGYRYDHRSKLLQIDEISAQTVKWIYDQYLKGERGYRHIAEKLEESGVPGPTDMRWNKNFVRKILTSPIYAGFIGHQGNLYPGKHEHIIEPEKWREVQALIRDRGAVRAAATVYTGFLSGIIWCGECGARMRVKNVWQNHPCTDPKKVIRYYVCYSQDGSARHMVRSPGCRCGYKHADGIENAVVNELYRYSFDRELLRRVVDEELAKNTDKNSVSRTINQAVKDLASVEKKLERWYDAFEKGALEPDELMERVKELRERKSYLQNHIPELESRLKEEDARQANAEEVLELFHNFPAIWEEATPGERREIVVNLVKSVQVFGDDRIQVEFNV
ncbi:MAG: recombinase family protein [Firmicutes bacterium]|nr:recombinase family protein [Bacillota bacterium]